MGTVLRGVSPPIGRIKVNIVSKKIGNVRHQNTLAILTHIHIQRDSSLIGTGPGPRLAEEPVQGNKGIKKGVDGDYTLNLKSMMSPSFTG